MQVSLTKIRPVPLFQKEKKKRIVKRIREEEIMIDNNKDCLA